MNVISDQGLLDRIGQLTSVLTGFFVAALVAIAAFTLDNSALDEEISVGKVFDNSATEGEPGLTRREYVCYMFGYLVGVSFVLSAISVLLVSFSNQFRFIYSYAADVLIFENGLISKECALTGWKFLLVFFTVFLFVHVVFVSLRGIFYLMYKLYEKKSVISKKPGRMPLDPPPD